MALNIANIDKLLTTLRRAKPENFDMRFVFRGADGEESREIIDVNECGTAACIAGWCAVAAGAPQKSGWFSRNSELWLGLRGPQYSLLFMPDGFDFRPEDFPLARAIDVVQHLRDTGEVDWDRFPASAYREPPAAPKRAWSPPVAIEIAPELPESLTDLLRPRAEASHAG